jgi:single-strand DNA-binding protein
MNNVTIVGAVGGEGPELRFTNSGKAVAVFTVYESYQPKDGGERTYSNYDCELWEAAGEHFAESAQKGDSVIVVGRLKQEKWETKDGDKRSKIKVTVSDIGLSTRWNPVQVVRSERSS